MARFILSKFSFVAHPATVSDDIGSDFFCTVFQSQREGKLDYLIPKNSFAIQVKSSKKNLDVSNKVRYLSDLEVPFFMGVTDRRDLKLTIYSGEYIPAFFSYKGLPKTLEIELLEEAGVSDYFVEQGRRSYILRFPRLTEVGADTEREELNEKVQILCKVCSLIHGNIASRKGGEYIFPIYNSSTLLIFAGSGSTRVFRENFLRRLAEVFYNLNWIYENNRHLFKKEEFKCYEQVFLRIKDLYRGELPGYLTSAFESLKVSVNTDTKLHKPESTEY